MSRRFSLRTTLFAAALGVAALSTTLAPAAASAEDSGYQGAKPTIVLVHGAFADAGSWNEVTQRLQRNGFPVLAVANPLRGVPTDAAAIRQVVDSVKGPVILVGHSYGGTVISHAAAGDKDVKALVYIAAFAPAVGESAGQLSAGGKLGPDTTRVVGNDLYIRPESFHEVFAADLPRRTTALMAAAQRPIDAGALGFQATAAAWQDIPSWYLVAKQDNAIPADSQRAMAARAKSHTTEVNASHAVSVSRPDATYATILGAVRGTR
ncbi:alpha/beta fold hydrolase [Crossiella cryophila]|uniref:Pimeloyl-ACP methyl ester carboxylesterase n=1 Tax=Crossiella cryophila TaxID=43355 RepID=A0A7W7CK73_9PSEU|nr:alpha/beta hydrolase [Crossiella cryophila]MBB4681316.1 pimeloyl-ACP methyl ester carboxylesterase [Crossiella cryophila]